MSSSFVTLEAGTKFAGFGKTGLLYMVQLIPDLSPQYKRRLLRVLTFDTATDILETQVTLGVYQNQVQDQSSFHKACLNASGTILGIYIQHTETFWSADQPLGRQPVTPSWFLEVDLGTMEVKRNPCTRVKLESNFSQLYHTDTKWQWIMAGYALGRGFQEFEFHSFASGDYSKDDGSQYFQATVLTVASPVSRGQNLGVLGDKLYSIFANGEEENSWKFSFYNLQNADSNENSAWHSLSVRPKSPSNRSPERLLRLVIVEGKLCALELSKADNELRLWKVERNPATESRQPAVTEAAWNLWKTYDILIGNYEAYDLQVSPFPIDGDHLVVMKMFHLPRAKLQYSMDAVRVAPLVEKKTNDLSSPSRRQQKINENSTVENHVS